MVWRRDEKLLHGLLLEPLPILPKLCHLFAGGKMEAIAGSGESQGDFRYFPGGENILQTHLQLKGGLPVLSLETSGDGHIEKVEIQLADSSKII